MDEKSTHDEIDLSDETGLSPDIDLSADEQGMSLLRAGVPLSLLIDLTFPDGPYSHDLFLHETNDSSVWHRPA